MAKERCGDKRLHGLHEEIVESGLVSSLRCFSEEHFQYLIVGAEPDTPQLYMTLGPVMMNVGVVCPCQAVNAASPERLRLDSQDKFVCLHCGRQWDWNGYISGCFINAWSSKHDFQRVIETGVFARDLDPLNLLLLSSLLCDTVPKLMKLHTGLTCDQWHDLKFSL